MMVDHHKLSQKFVDINRKEFFGDINNDQWLDQFHIINLADKYNISSIIATGGNHHRLVTDIVDNKSVFVYDPLFTRNGNHHYMLNSNEIENFVLTGDIRNKINPQEWYNYNYRSNLSLTDIENNINTKVASSQFRNLSDIISRIDNDYSINLPELGKLQDDYHNCGILSLYAALVSNVYNNELKDKLNMNVLRYEGIIK